MPRHNKDLRIQGKGGCDTFYAVRSYFRSGVQLCDIANSDGFLAYSGCVVWNSATNRISAPTEKWNPGSRINPKIHPLVIAIYRSLGRNPIILGRVDNPDVFFGTPDGTRHGDADEDVNVEKAELDDIGLHNDKSKLVMKSSAKGGDMVVKPERGLKVQLSPDGFMKVSRGGESSDGPVLAGPYTERDKAIVGILNQLISYLRELRLVSYQPGPKPLPFFDVADVEDVELAKIKSAVLALSSETGDD